MKISCDIIKDLLPLYNDGVCSDESVKLVDQHLKECGSCTVELNRLKEDSPVRMLKLEEKDIIGEYRKSLLNKTVFFVLCLIVVPLFNTLISVFSTPLLDYFSNPYDFGTGVGIAAAVFAINCCVILNSVYLPCVLKTNRKVKISVYSSIIPILVLIVMTCSLGGQHAPIITIFLMPAVAYLALSVAFIPSKLRMDSKSPMRYKKASTRLSIVETLLLPACAVWVGFIFGDNIHMYENTPATLFVSIPCLLLLWSITLIYRFSNVNSIIKASANVFLIGLFISTFTTVWRYSGMQRLGFGRSDVYYSILDCNLSDFGSNNRLPANISMIILIVFVIIALALFAIGSIGDKKIVTEGNPETDLKNVLKNASQDVFKIVSSKSENNSEDSDEIIPDSSTENNSEDTAETTPDSISENNSEDTAETTPDSSTENALEDTAEITPDSSPENKE